MITPTPKDKWLGFTRWTVIVRTPVSFKSTSIQLLCARGCRGTVAGHEMDDFQPIEHVRTHLSPPADLLHRPLVPTITRVVAKIGKLFGEQTEETFVTLLRGSDSLTEARRPEATSPEGVAPVWRANVVYRTFRSAYRRDIAMDLFGSELARSIGSYAPQSHRSVLDPSKELVVQVLFDAQPWSQIRLRAFGARRRVTLGPATRGPPAHTVRWQLTVHIGTAH